jgi:hypothetical protein
VSPRRSLKCEEGYNKEGKIIVRKLLTFIALACVLAIAGGVSISTANASPQTSAAHFLKVEQSSAVEKAYYTGRHYHHHRRHCWWHHHHRHCRWY